MSIMIHKYGAGATIQDAGRYGYQHLGINPNGAMDLIALRIANTLVTNKPTEAVIEFIFPAPAFYFTRSAFIALSGANFNAVINDLPIPINQAIYIPAGSILQFTKKITGNFCYLAIQGGFDLDDWLGSYSTNSKVGAGGLNGGFLQKNDQLFFRTNVQQEQNKGVSILPWRADTSSFYSDTIYFTAGPEYEFLSTINQQKLIKHAFSIEPNSDRMGYRLRGEPLATNNQTNLLSSAVTRGTMQLLPSGQFIVLMADHQTTGGYPRIGTIITASFPSLAQHPFGHSVTFMKTTFQAAISTVEQQQRNLQILQQACILRAKEHF